MTKAVSEKPANGSIATRMKRAEGTEKALSPKTLTIRVDAEVWEALKGVQKTGKPGAKSVYCRKAIAQMLVNDGLLDSSFLAEFEAK